MATTHVNEGRLDASRTRVRFPAPPPRNRKPRRMLGFSRLVDSEGPDLGSPEALLPQPFRHPLRNARSQLFHIRRAATCTPGVQAGLSQSAARDKSFR